MSMPWIKVRESIHEDPAVLQIASNLGTRPEHVVGYLIKFWSWVSRNCHAGSVTGVTLMSLECVLNLPGFCDQLVEVGWLEVDQVDGKTVLTIPKFDRHLSQSSKARALTTDRQRTARQKRHADVTQTSRCERDKSVTREDKIREDIHTHTHTADAAVSDPDKAEAIERWRSYRQAETGKAPSDEVLAGILRTHESWPADRFSAAVDFSIAKQAKSILDPAIDFQQEAAKRNQRPPPGGGKPAKDYSIPQFFAPEGSS